MGVAGRCAVTGRAGDAGRAARLGVSGRPGETGPAPGVAGRPSASASRLPLVVSTGATAIAGQEEPQKALCTFAALSYVCLV